MKQHMEGGERKDDPNDNEKKRKRDLKSSEEHYSSDSSNDSGTDKKRELERKHIINSVKEVKQDKSSKTQEKMSDAEKMVSYGVESLITMIKQQGQKNAEERSNEEGGDFKVAKYQKTDEKDKLATSHDEAKEEEYSSSEESDSKVAKYQKTDEKNKLATSHDKNDDSDKSADSVPLKELENQISENAKRLVELRNGANRQLESSDDSLFDTNLFYTIQEVNKFIEEQKAIEAQIKQTIEGEKNKQTTDVNLKRKLKNEKDANEFIRQPFIDYINEQEKYIQQLSLEVGQQQGALSYGEFSYLVSEGTDGVHLSDNEESYADSEAQKDEDIDYMHGELETALEKAESILGKEHESIKLVKEVIDAYIADDKSDKDDFIKKQTTAIDKLKDDYKKLTGKNIDQVKIDYGYASIYKQSEDADAGSKRTAQQIFELYYAGAPIADWKV